MKKTKSTPRATPRRCAVSTGSAIPFVNKYGHVMRLSRSMTLAELMTMGFSEIHIAKQGTPLRPGEWRDASPNTLGQQRPAADPVSTNPRNPGVAL